MRSSIVRLALASAALSAFTAACGGGKSGPDMGHPSTTYPAPHTAIPVVGKNGGSVAVSPVLVPVTYADDPMRATIDDFTTKIVASTYWGATTGEYGVGAATGAAPVHLTANAPTSTGGVAIDTDLATQLSSANPAYPVNAPGVIYLLFFPSTTTISDAQTGTACQDYGAYHSWTQVGSAYAAYAVIPRCSGGPGFPDQDVMTFAASHEIVEAATDPYGGGYAGSGDAVWDLISFGGELGDYCEYQPDIFEQPSDLGYLVQRTWSNAAATAGKNPCQPFSTPYFMAAPALPDTTSVNFGGGFSENGKVVKIATGSSRTIELDLYSDKDTSGPFTIEAQDLASLQGSPAELSFTFDNASGVNGEKRHLTIKTLKAPTLFSGGSLFLIITKQGQHENIWPAMVVP